MIDWEKQVYTTETEYTLRLTLPLLYWAFEWKVVQPRGYSNQKPEAKTDEN